VLVCVAAALLIAGGCEQKPAGRDPSTPAAYVKLSLTKDSASEQIIDEVARIEAAGWALTSTTAYRLGAEADPLAPPETPFAEAFPAKDARTIYDSTVAIYPADDFRFSSAQVAEAVRLRQAGDLFLNRFRRHLLSGPCDFGLDLREGLLADTSFVDVVRAGHRLEALEAAGLLERGRVDSAVDRLVGMLLISDQLDDIPHVVARLTAAELRSEAARVAEANTHLRLSNLIVAQLARRPSDADLWRGDRALGLHAYEMMRSGELLSLLTEEEIEALRQRGKLYEVANRLTAQADQDQEFYLAAMRELIAACEASYQERIRVITKIEDRLAALSGTPAEPYLAGKVLLANLRTANEMLSIDLATWRALARLLSADGHAGQSDHSINPITGKPFEISGNELRSIEIAVGSSPKRTIAIKAVP